jgi:Rod binding domain-containing protein
VDLASIGAFDRSQAALSRSETQGTEGLARRARASAGRDGATADAASSPRNLSELQDVAGKFEALFVEQMLSTMRDTLNKEDRLFDGGMAEEYFKDMLYEEYAAKIADQGDLGIADMIVDQYRSIL